MFFVLVFVLVWAVSLGTWLFLNRSVQSSDADKVKKRLMGGPRKKKSEKAGPALFNTEEQEDKILHRILAKFRWNERLRVMIEQSGLKWRVTRTAHGCIALFILGFVVARMMLPERFEAAAILFAAFAGAAPVFYIKVMRSKRLTKFEEIFPESLEFIARSMRAGHALSVSLEMLHREFPEPLSGEFRKTFEEHNLGLPLDAALEKLSKRIPLLDVQFFVSAVLLQKRTGGNLAEILDKLAYVIRERFKLRGKIKAICAHGRMTGTALSCIPLGVAGMMFLSSREYIMFFIEDELGGMMIAAALVFQIVGYLIIRKIVSIEV
jgi:tight adherence protein B